MDKLRAEAHELAEAVTALTRSVTDLADRTHRSERFIKYLAASLVLSVLLILAFGVAGWKVRAITDCQAQHNEAFRQSILIRQEAASLDRRGQRQLLDTILNPAATQQQRRDAVETYRQYLAEAEQARTENPLPAGSNCR